MAQINIQWQNADFTWDLAPSDIGADRHKWNNAVKEVVEEIVSGGKNWRRRDKDKKKRRQVIRLLMWRKGIKVYDEKKEIENINLYIDDIKIIAEELKKDVQIIY